jgi:hypothetical protein
MDIFPIGKLRAGAQVRLIRNAETSVGLSRRSATTYTALPKDNCLGCDAPSRIRQRLELCPPGVLHRKIRPPTERVGLPSPMPRLRENSRKSKDSGKRPVGICDHRCVPPDRPIRPSKSTDLRRLRGGRRPFAEVAVRHPVALSRSGMTQQGLRCRQSRHSPSWSARASKADIRTKELRGS